MKTPQIFSIRDLRKKEIILKSGKTDNLSFQKIFPKLEFCFYQSLHQVSIQLFQYWRLNSTRTATEMDGTLHTDFENLKPVEISKNIFNFI